LGEKRKRTRRSSGGKWGFCQSGGNFGNGQLRSKGRGRGGFPRIVDEGGEGKMGVKQGAATFLRGGNDEVDSLWKEALT